MEQLSEDQRQQMLRKRQEMLKKMGVSNAGQMMNESVVDTGKSNSSMAQKLTAIKNGSAKAELNKYIQATAKGESGAGGFKGIPESKPRKNNEEVKPEYKQQLDKFDIPGSSHSEMGELSAIESMFGGEGSRISMGNNQPISQNPVNMELSLDSMVMPSFNPQAALQQKAKNKTQTQPNQSSYLKFASDTPPIQQEFVEVGGQPQFNIQQLQVMMETIAKGIAEKAIKNVLNEYSEQQKSKNYFEYYNKEKAIIKTPDGKYYKLTELKKKQ